MFTYIYIYIHISSNIYVFMYTYIYVHTSERAYTFAWRCSEPVHLQQLRFEHRWDMRAPQAVQALFRQGNHSVAKSRHEHKDYAGIVYGPL